ncbi:tautomerase family protein [Serratia ureilytica]
MTIDQIARAMGSDAEQQQFLAGCTRILQPYLAARGLHVGETPFSLWTIEGLKPPLPGTAAGENGVARTGLRCGGAALAEFPMLKSDDERRFLSSLKQSRHHRVGAARVTR